MAIYPFAHKPVPAELRLSGDAGEYLHFRCISKPLKCLLAKEHLESNNIVERLCLPLMRVEAPEETKANEEKCEAITRAFDGLMDLEPSADLRQKYFEFIFIYAGSDLAELNIEELERHCLTRGKHKEAYMSLLQQLEDRGVKKNLKKIKLDFIRDQFSRNVLSRDVVIAEIEELVKRGEVSRSEADQVIKSI